MKHISILIPEGDASLVNIEGCYQIFTEVNNLMARAEMPPMFKIQLVGLKKETTMRKGIYSIHPDAVISDIHHTDLIIIPAIFVESKHPDVSHVAGMDSLINSILFNLISFLYKLNEL